MLTHQQFNAVYALLDRPQTLDAHGNSVDCGVRCGKFCCTGGTTKYLLPGEQEFLASEMSRMGNGGFDFKSMVFFDSFAAEVVEIGGSLRCVCDAARSIRPFNCRAFPYAPRIVGQRVVDLDRNALRYLQACWIDTPAAHWKQGAIEAWQTVLSDAESLFLFARFGLAWDWNQAVERGENPGPVLPLLAQMKVHNTADNWARAARFFVRTD